MVAGLLLRVGLGLLAFWISYLDLPLGRGLHSANGFWEVAPDAYSYAVRASQAAREGLATIAGGSPSPGYVRILAVWMRLVGISPASGMFLNLVLYGLLCALVVQAWKPFGEWRRDLPPALFLAGFSFSPALLYHSTQPLKDEAFAVFTAIAAVGSWFVLPAISPLRRGGSLWGSLSGLGLLLVALYLMAGIRLYYAMFVWCSLVVALGVTLVPWRVQHLWRTLPLAGVVLALALFSCAVGGGDRIGPL